MPIYLIRHGQSEFNAAHGPGLPDPMIRDAPLTAKGVEQARAARREVARLGIRLVIASPLTRALQTAQHIFGGTHEINVMVEPRERLEHSCDVGSPPDALRAAFPDLDFDHIPEVWWHTGTPNELGYTPEPTQEFSHRIGQFAAQLATMSPRPIAVVGHGNTFRQLVGYQMENCEICRYGDG
jgi:broad specificity phosphatase PhoE